MRTRGFLDWKPGRLPIVAAFLVAGLGGALALAAFGSGCSWFGSAGTATGPNTSWFVDITGDSGLDFVHDAGPVGSYFLPQLMASGVALFDFDGDGLLDIYLIHNGGPNGKKNQLFRQGPPGKFTDVSAGSGLDVAGYGMGVAVGDINNDGRPDLVLTEYRGIRLFLNNGDGTFTDITKEAGIDHPLWATSACFFDYDRDGWLDLAVTNYATYQPIQCEGLDGEPDYCPPNRFTGQVTRLYHNLGRRTGDGPKTVRFEDVTLKSGLGQLQGGGMGIIALDFTGDGWPDLFISVDGHANWLWVNNRDGTFREEGFRRGVAYNRMGVPEGNMGIAVGDVNGSGMASLYVTHLTDELNTLWVQGPRGQFRDRTAAAGLAVTRWRGTGFGVAMGDFDNDGNQDLALVNGRVARGKPMDEEHLGKFWCRYAERNQLFAGDGTGKFRDVSDENPAFCGWYGVSRALAIGDLDGDGGLDVVVSTTANRARLFKNAAPNRGHWISVRALDPRLKRDAYCAEITVQAGDRRWVGWVNPAQGYLSSSDPRVHFGLGQVDRVDSITVRWPDGEAEEEIFAGGPADRAIPLRRGEGQRADPK